MSVGLVLSVFERDDATASAEAEIPLTVARTLASARFLALLPESDAGKFLRRHDSRGYSRRAKPPPLATAAVAISALDLVETILALERPLDILVCEDLRTGRELAQVRFVATAQSYARSQSYDTREFAEIELGRIHELPAGVAEARYMPDFVLRGVASGIERVGDEFREYVTEEIEIRLTWRTAITCHRASWAELRTRVAASPDARFRLTTC